MKLNLEQTVQYLLNIVQSGIKPEKWLTQEQLTAYITDENVGKYYLVSRDGVDHLYYITRRDNGGLIADDLGQFPAKGAQGVPGEKGDSPTVSISNNNTWIIDGVDTGKPSRGKQGEKGNTGMQGVPGVGVSAMLSIDSTDYTPTVTDDGEYQDVESSANIRYSGDGEEHSTQVDFNIKVPKGGVDHNKTPVIEELGNYAGLIPVTTGDHVWGQAFMSEDPTSYAIVQRNASGGITSVQDQLYVHEGTLAATYNGEGHTVYYRAISTKPTAFASRDDVFAAALVNRAVPYDAAGETDSLVTARISTGGHIRIATFGTNAKEVGCQALTFSTDNVIGKLE